MWVIAALAIAGCSRQEAGWDEAARENSVGAYQSYLDKFPAGVHAAEARARVAELQEEAGWTRANRLRTPEAWQRYLGEWPDGRHAALARRQLVAFIPPEAPAAHGDFAVQLGAYSSEAATRENLARLAREHATELAGQALVILAPQLPETDVWRLRTGPLAEGAARDLCERLRSGGVDCVPVAAISAGQPPP
jgi:hypothetical protein